MRSTNVTMLFGALFSLFPVIAGGAGSDPPCSECKGSTLQVFSQFGHTQFLITGNTLGLSGDLNANGPGTQGSIHTFTSTNIANTDNLPANPGNPWPAQTTSDYTMNSSSAPLAIPAGATVVHAQLIWAGSYRYVDDVSGALGNSVQFTSPAGASLVAPNSATARTLDFTTGNGLAVAYYLRNADVTAQVVAGGSGSYMVSGVPGTQHELINSANAAGWALVVAVSEPGFACRKLELQIAGQWVDEDQTSLLTFTDFETPATGPVSGRLVLAALEGDATRTGDSVAISNPVAAGLITLTTPNNPSGNFFASQVNDANGNLNTQGTWGTVNHNAQLALNLTGARQGWDITGVPLSKGGGQLANNQLGSSIQTASSGDELMLAFVALEIDSNPSLCPAVPLIFSDGFESQASPAK